MTQGSKLQAGSEFPVPDLAGLLSGIKNTREKNHPVRGTKA